MVSTDLQVHSALHTESRNAAYRAFHSVGRLEPPARQHSALASGKRPAIDTQGSRGLLRSRRGALFVGRPESHEASRPGGARSGLPQAIVTYSDLRRLTAGIFRASRYLATVRRATTKP